MREMAATGDLTRRVSLKSRPWDDEDARLLASTFNTLTESIARFQREAAQKERLSALGRLSTVIAHEIRNPLMIIKSSLPQPAARHRHGGGAARGGRRHRRGNHAPEPHRHRGARLRPADPVRPGGGRPQRDLPRLGGGGLGRRRRRPGVALDLDATHSAAAHRRRAAADRARQPADQRAPCGGRRGTGRHWHDRPRPAEP